MMLTPAYPEIDDSQRQQMRVLNSSYEGYHVHAHEINGSTITRNTNLSYQNQNINQNQNQIDAMNANQTNLTDQNGPQGNDTVSVGLGHVVQWLVDNYEIAEGESLPRSTLYAHYQDFCEQINCGPVNPASFGKVIRSVFTGLKTRRLGTRGNSKYHYFGIKIRNDSPLVNPQHAEHHSHHQDWSQETGSESDDGGRSNDHNNLNTQARKRTHLSANSHHGDNGENISNNCQNNSISNSNKDLGGPKNNNQSISESLSYYELRSYLGSDDNNSVNIVVSSNWRSINEVVLMELANVPVTQIQLFETKYRQLYESILQSLHDLKFDQIENLLYQFWSGINEHQQHNNISGGRENQANDKVASSGLSFETLHLMTSTSNAFIDWIIDVDYNMYAMIDKFILPDILAPIPRILTQKIRLFAKNLESWMQKAIGHYQNRLSELKIKVAKIFGFTLKRHTDLNHTATAANAVWKNEMQIQQMRVDLSRVDMKYVQHQAELVSQCNLYTAEEIFQGFKFVLQDSSPIDRWSSWCRELIDSRIDGSDSKVAESFLLRWSNYVSLIMKELTLRSSTSFGSFHLVHVLLDQYLSYLVVEKKSRFHRKTQTQLSIESRICDKS